MLYNISLLLIYFIHSSLCLFILYPYLAPSPFLTPPVTTSLFSISVNLFLFVSKFICIIIFLDSTYKWYHMIFVFAWLTSHNMIISRSIHIAANGIISFFFMAEWYSIVYVYYIFFIHSSVHGHLSVSVSSLLWIVLLWTYRCIYPFKL